MLSLALVLGLIMRMLNRENEMADKEKKPTTPQAVGGRGKKRKVKGK